MAIQAGFKSKDQQQGSQARRDNTMTATRIAATCRMSGAMGAQRSGEGNGQARCQVCNSTYRTKHPQQRMASETGIGLQKVAKVLGRQLYGKSVKKQPDVMQNTRTVRGFNKPASW